MPATDMRVGRGVACRKRTTAGFAAHRGAHRSDRVASPWFPATPVVGTADAAASPRRDDARVIPRSLMLHLTDTTTSTIPEVVDARYWLTHSDGYRVTGPPGRIGTVDRVIDHAETLVVRTGILGSGRLSVGFAEVALIEPWSERLCLQEEPRSGSAPMTKRMRSRVIPDSGTGRGQPRPRTGGRQ